MAEDILRLLHDSSRRSCVCAALRSGFAQESDDIQVVIARSIVHSIFCASFCPILVEKLDHLQAFSCSAIHDFSRSLKTSAVLMSPLHDLEVSSEAVLLSGDSMGVKSSQDIDAVDTLTIFQNSQLAVSRMVAVQVFQHLHIATNGGLNHGIAYPVVLGLVVKALSLLHGPLGHGQATILYQIEVLCERFGNVNVQTVALVQHPLNHMQVAIGTGTGKGSFQMFR